MRRPFGPTFLAALALAASPSLAAQTPAAEPSPTPEAVARLERELAELRREYAEKLRTLEQKIEALQAAVAAPVPAETPPPAPPLPPLAMSSKIFNPDIAVIGDFLGAAGRNDTETAPGSLDFHEAEASFQAVLDPYARGDFFFAFTPEGVEVEEGFITFTTLPAKLLLKAGKLRAGFGKVNTMHIHALPWTDRPLVTENLLGGEEGISDAGLSLARLIPIGETFLEATAEVYSGHSTLFDAPERQDLTYVGRLRGYRDLSESANLDLGGSFAYGHNGMGPDTTTRLFGVDATFRYRPLRRAIYKRLLARGELVWSRAQTGPETFDSFGGYFSTEYQFARRWFAGARLDASGRSYDELPKDKGGSLLLTFWPSEYSQVRGQWRYTKLGAGGSNNEFLFQLLFSIGAHGAHAF
jgi:hypothetical protein